eukprot:s476_g6.t1
MMLEQHTMVLKEAMIAKARIQDELRCMKVVAIEPQESEEKEKEGIRSPADRHHGGARWAMVGPRGWLLISWAVVRLSEGFYLPGLSPVEYQQDALVDMKVNKLTSVKTQLPYDYYTLPFCQPKSILSSAENLGEILEGDRIENSPYEIRMKKDVICQVLCKQTLTPEMRKKFQTMIKDAGN